MIHVKLFALLFMVVFCTSCKEQNKTSLPKDLIKFETNFEITPTVPNNITRTIKQDRNGNIWIAAFDGVFRYDGKSFTNITNHVSSARFFSVLEDRKGNFWFSSVGSGVYYYDGMSFQNYTTKEGLANDRVIDIYEDKSGHIWFGTEGGASRYDGKSFRNYLMNEGWPNTEVEGLSHKNHNDVNSIIEDKSGKFWFGTRGYACIFDGKTFTVITNNGKPFTNVRSIIEDKNGNIWLGGNDGLWRYDGITFNQFTQNFVGYIYEDKIGNIWTSSQNANDQKWALSRYDEKSLSDKEPTVTVINSKYEDNKGMIFGILESDDGSIWFGALDGVYRYDGKAIMDFKSKAFKK